VDDQSAQKSAFTAGPWSVIGRGGEPRAIGITKSLLEAHGFQVALKDSKDSHGEDRIFSIAGTDYTGQVTSIPDAPKFWGQSRQTSVATTVSPQHAASWLRGGIDKKARVMSEEQRANTILVLDAHHWGDRLAKPEIVALLTDSAINPALKYGFAGISIAGNSPSNSTWLAGGLR
jgi:hypothetical protein